MAYSAPRIPNISLRYNDMQAPYTALEIPVLYDHQPPSPDHLFGSSSTFSAPCNTSSSMDPDHYPPDLLQLFNTRYINPEFAHSQFQIQSSSDSSRTHINFEDPQTYHAGIPPNHPLNFSSMPSQSPHLSMSSSIDDFTNYPDNDTHYRLSPSPEAYSRDELHHHANRRQRTWPSDAQTEEYLRKTLPILPSLPLNLWSLPDIPPTKPLPKIAVLIKLAIWGSPGHKLTLRQIYKAIEERYPFLQNADDKPWQRSIRHSLSLRAIFVRMDRPDNHPGKGYYWRLDVSEGEAYTRDRRRQELDNNEAHDFDDYMHSDTGSEGHQRTFPAPIPSDYGKHAYKHEETSADIYPLSNTAQIYGSSRMPRPGSNMYGIDSSHGTYEPQMRMSTDNYHIGGAPSAPHHRNTIPSSRAMGNHVPTSMPAPPMLMGEQWPHRRNTTENMPSRTSYQLAPPQSVPMGGVSHTPSMRSARRHRTD